MSAEDFTFLLYAQFRAGGDFQHRLSNAIRAPKVMPPDYRVVCDFAEENGASRGVFDHFDYCWWKANTPPCFVEYVIAKVISISEYYKENNF